jgi:hypothetical protein
MKKINESALHRIIKKIISENETNEQLYGKASSSIDKLKQKNPSGINLTKTLSATGSGAFKNGQSEINTNNEGIKVIIGTISSQNQTCGGPVTVVVNGSASAVGSPTYDNKGLANKRMLSLINYIKSLSYKNVTVTPGSATVGKSTVKNSPESEKEQKVTATITCKGKMNVPIVGVQGDNTNVYNPKFEKVNPLDPKPKPTPGPGPIKLKRVCVKIPESLVKKYTTKVSEFKKENNLGEIPFGIYDVK